MTGKQKQEVKKIAKQFAGTDGAPGANGTSGANGKDGAAGPEGKAGVAGADGSDGSDGSDGTNGTNGTNGANGISVSNTAESPGGNCANGGSKFTVGAGAPTYACNGANGQTGFTATLPTKQTETGTYLVASESGDGYFLEEYALSTISFAIPLAAPLAEANVILVTTVTAPPECENTEDPGTASGETPEADPGYLCFYEGAKENISETLFTDIEGQTTGITVAANPSAPKAFVKGTWAVTAP